MITSCVGHIFRFDGCCHCSVGMDDDDTAPGGTDPDCYHTSDEDNASDSYASDGDGSADEHDA